MTETGTSGSSLWSRVALLGLMFLVLVVAGTLSAVTAMKFAIQGREVSVPDLVGTREAEAGSRLAGQDLELVVDGRRFSESVPEGEVFDQSPPEGTRVKRERRVRVRISLGPREFPVPDLAGASLRSAQLLLTQRGMSLGSTLYAHAEEVPAGTVLFQNPAPGARESDPAVSVLISLGPVDQYFVMPALVGARAADVRGRIRAAGFRLTERADSEAAAPAGTIVGQLPPAGHRVSSDDTIVLGVRQ